MTKTKIALLGSGFIADIHIESYQRFVPEAEVVAVWSRSPEKAASFAKRHHIPKHYPTLEQAITESGSEIVDVCVPNFLHHRAVLAAANAGKHVIIEKPLAMTLEEADEMIAVCKSKNRKLMYAEELCFAPKYERVRKLVNEKAIGKIYQMRQCEKHSGPHSDWFYDINQSGGGALMDMGCHGIAWFRWMLGGWPKVRSVFAQMQNGLIHGKRTRAEENSICMIEFEDGAIGVAENSWAKHGGMDDRVEVYGTQGVIYADLFMGNSALTYSEKGYGYAMEKAGSTQGWTFTIFEEAFNQGYPQELRHFVECVREDKQPVVTAEDGRAVLEIMYAAYESARTGQKVPLPFSPKVKKPIDLWLGNMNLFKFDSEAAWINGIASFWRDRLRTNPELRMCLPSGHTPNAIYAAMGKAVAAGQVSFEHAEIYALDEFGGLAPDDEGLCANMLQRYLLKFIDLPAQNFHRIEPNKKNIAREYDELIGDGFDLSLLGVGLNGHLGMNEPGSPIDGTTHRVELHPTTVASSAKYLTHGNLPTWGVAVGLKHLLGSKEVWLLANGAKKAEIIQRAAKGPVGPDVPASLLRNHPNAFFMVDAEAGALV